MNFNIFYFNDVARLHHDAAFFWHAPTHPQIHTGLWSDKRHIVGTVLHDGGSNVHVDMIVMIVRGENGIDLANGERIENKRRGAQVWLEFLHACHTLHLMARFHQWITVALLACSAPKSTQTLVPPSDFSQIPVQPSHHIAKVPCNLFLFDLFV